MIYSTLSRLLPNKPPEALPRRIVLIRPCCIGDAVMATAALAALRRAFPAAHITWAVGSWSAAAVAHHPALDALLDTGAGHLPLRSPRELLRFVRQLRAGRYDMAVSLVRSPLMSLAVCLAGIPLRAGLDSAGRGFGYNLRVPIDPAARQHECAVYLKVVSAVTSQPLDADASLPNLPLNSAAQAAVTARLTAAKIRAPYIVAHPGGGQNPGMHMSHKRYPPRQLAQLLNRAAEAKAAQVILIAGPGEAALAQAVADALSLPHSLWLDALSFPQLGALAAGALFYIGNDTGATHVAAASGARTVMMMGPTDPRRYAPHSPDCLVLWKPQPLPAGGVAAAGRGWDWARDGFGVDDAVDAILRFLR